ncbi:MBL fold metallo-hydrolase [Bacillus mojavensis]|uniref:MBL fold metallo-hydrolase n=1 Tax=Bacillus mojavensis TaxID=72360 RepID=UPI002DB848EC|nr:MBL fold metallo-hydrolase [Bacillus mojavensis]MEC1672248.1 MBL fold metallo-hydrolase [Bacillus mojavensis]MEC1749634.1 MBL fold metallo-hydrolase [Bacillus mojavensis]
MRMIQNQTVRQLTFYPALFPVNCYLVEEENEVTLIDTGLPNSYKGIIQAVNQLGKPLQHILLTHAHGDHVGSLDVLSQAFPDAKVVISERDSFLLKGDVSLRKDEPQTPIKGGIPKNIKTKPDVLLAGGETIGSLLAISTPGHTPGSMSFLDTRNGIVIAGDAFQLRGGIAVSGQMRWTFPFPAFATWNKKAAVRSAERLVDKAPSCLAVGHGHFLASPEQSMKLAIQKAKKGV